jgi:hypothetical protein
MPFREFLSPRNSKELSSIHPVEEFTRSQIRISVSRMTIDQRQLDDAAEDQNGSLAEGLGGTIKSVLNNPVLPSEFDLFAPICARHRKWDFANKNPIPFAKAWKPFQSSHTVGDL